MKRIIKEDELNTLVHVGKVDQTTVAADNRRMRDLMRASKEEMVLEQKHVEALNKLNNLLDTLVLMKRDEFIREGKEEKVAESKQKSLKDLSFQIKQINNSITSYIERKLKEEKYENKRWEFSVHRNESGFITSVDVEAK